MTEDENKNPKQEFSERTQEAVTRELLDRLRKAFPKELSKAVAESVDKEAISALLDGLLGLSRRVHNFIKDSKTQDAISQMAASVGTFMAVANDVFNAYSVLLPYSKEERQNFFRLLTKNDAEADSVIEQLPRLAYLDVVRNLYCFTRRNKDAKDVLRKLLRIEEGEAKNGDDSFVTDPAGFAVSLFFYKHLKEIAPGDPARLDEDQVKELRKMLNYCASFNYKENGLQEFFEGFDVPESSGTGFVPTRLLIPNHKVARIPFDQKKAVVNDPEGVNVSLSKTNTEIRPKVFYASKKNLNTFTMNYRSTMIAIDSMITEWEALHRTDASEKFKCSVKDIYSARSGMKKDDLPESANNEISEQMDVLWDSKAWCEERIEKDGKVFIRPFQDRILNFRKYPVRMPNGSVSYEYEFHSRPILSELSQELRQFFTFPRELLAIRKASKKGDGFTSEYLRDDTTRQTIRTFMLVRIICMKRDGVYSNRITIDEIFEAAEIDSKNRYARKRVIDYCIACLNFWDWTKHHPLKNATAEERLQAEAEKQLAKNENRYIHSGYEIVTEGRNHQITAFVFPEYDRSVKKVEQLMQEGEKKRRRTTRRKAA